MSNEKQITHNDYWGAIAALASNVEDKFNIDCPKQVFNLFARNSLEIADNITPPIATYIYYDLIIGSPWIENRDSLRRVLLYTYNRDNAIKKYCKSGSQSADDAERLKKLGMYSMYGDIGDILIEAITKEQMISHLEAIRVNNES